MPSPSPIFTGQRSYLEKLKSHFGPREGQSLRRRLFLLSGMGGIGKTQICLKFIEENPELCIDRHRTTLLDHLSFLTGSGEPSGLMQPAPRQLSSLSEILLMIMLPKHLELRALCTQFSHGYPG